MSSPFLSQEGGMAADWAPRILVTARETLEECGVRQGWSSWSGSPTFPNIFSRSWVAAPSHRSGLEGVVGRVFPRWCQWITAPVRSFGAVGTRRRSGVTVPFAISAASGESKIRYILPVRCQVWPMHRRTCRHPMIPPTSAFFTAAKTAREGVDGGVRAVRIQCHWRGIDHRADGMPQSSSGITVCQPVAWCGTMP
jgi:hypothetical protein